MATSNSSDLPFSAFFDREGSPANGTDLLAISEQLQEYPADEGPARSPQKIADKAARQQVAPMMRSYLELKKRYPEHMLLYQVGDFYEVFYEDAQVVSETLNIRLTSRDKDQENPVPMCGVPIHALDNYLPKLVQSGLSCVVVDQAEDPATAKGTVKREISRIVTPGVRYEGDGLDEKSFNYLGAFLCSPRSSGAFVYFDVSTGQLRIEEFERAEDGKELVGRVRPAELLLPNVINGVKVERTLAWLKEVKETARQSSCHFVLRPFEKVEREFLKERLARLLNARTVVAGGGADWLKTLCPESLICLDVVLSYVEEVSFGRLPHIAQVRIEEKKTQAVVDQATCRNLELFASGINSTRQNSLVESIDYTVTPMGARLLRDWILNPSRELDEINQRHELVAEFIARGDDREKIRRSFQQVRDLDRVVSRIVSGRGVPRDLGNLRDSVAVLPTVKALLLESRATLGQNIAECFDDLADIHARLVACLVEEPPLKVNEGGIFRQGYHSEIDRLHEISTNGKSYLASFEEEEKRRTGISGLKVKYNNVFGYFIEITKANLAKAPENYERRQTLTNAERFVTPELKAFEQTILSARAKQIELEKQLFSELREEVAGQAGRIQQVAASVALVDLMLSYAQLAVERNYCRPEMVTESVMDISKGRHPVVEEVIGRHNFVANDAHLDAEDCVFAILTGPNMGGKSTYLRQIGLIQLLAQAGSFVPAERARLGVVDRIFTRIGSSDDISRGDSTFMVEMREAATIVRKATDRSLVLIDEIGRGTATTDGLAIATAIAEWLNDRLHCRTVFATHFHELTSLPEQKKGMFCLAVGIIEKGAEIIFTHRIERGAADRSYGIEVARLAGLPETLLKRAQMFLAAPVTERPAVLREAMEAIEIPGQPDYSDLVRCLNDLDPDQLKPLEALLELSKLKGLLNV